MKNLLVGIFFTLALVSCNRYPEPEGMVFDKTTDSTNVTDTLHVSKVAEETLEVSYYEVAISHVYNVGGKEGIEELTYLVEAKTELEAREKIRQYFLAVKGIYEVLSYSPSKIVTVIH